MIDEKKLIEEILEHKDKIKSCDKRVDEVYELAHDHIIDIINIQPKTDWIPCEVEMPKDETLMYWTTHEDGSIIMHGYLKRNGFIYNWEVDDLEKRKRQGKVVAWMPIFKPQPYKKEGAENE